MELTCNLSPLVFCELYDLLGGLKEHKETVSDRLAEVELDLDWLDEAARRYREAWSEDSSAAEGPGALRALTPEHAVLASWIMAPLATLTPSDEFSANLRFRVQQQFLAAFPDATSLPPSVKPVVPAWSLALVAGGLDAEFPAVPSWPPADASVAAAYRGLLNHLLHIEQVSTPWPEMLGTSVLWRSTGLAEGMVPEAPNAPEAVLQVALTLQSLVRSAVVSGVTRHLSLLVERRNVLSHVAPMPHKPTFVDVHDSADEWSKLRPFVAGLTYFMCSKISEDLTTSASKVVHAGYWDAIQYELYAFGSTGD